MKAAGVPLRLLHLWQDLTLLPDLSADGIFLLIEGALLLFCDGASVLGRHVAFPYFPAANDGWPLIYAGGFSPGLIRQF
jgi:hypothetical protein